MGHLYTTPALRLHTKAHTGYTTRQCIYSPRYIQYALRHVVFCYSFAWIVRFHSILTCFLFSFFFSPPPPSFSNTRIYREYSYFLSLSLSFLAKILFSLFFDSNFFSNSKNSIYFPTIFFVRFEGKLETRIMRELFSRSISSLFDRGKRENFWGKLERGIDPWKWKWKDSHSSLCVDSSRARSEAVRSVRGRRTEIL